jgi:hypothetical protein
MTPRSLSDPGARHSQAACNTTACNTTACTTTACTTGCNTTGGFRRRRADAHLPTACPPAPATDVAALLS